MKKVGIDARLLYQTGVGVYLRNLLYYLQKYSEDITFFIYVLKKDANKVSLTRKNFVKRETDSLWHSLSEQTEFLKEINKDKLDLMHFTYFGFPIRYKRKYISTIHDLTPLFFKTGVSTKNPLIYKSKFLIFKNLVLATQVKKSYRLITPTKSVKKQIVDYYGNKYADKIISVYEGVSYELPNAKENTKLAKRFKNYFLYVSNFYPHKNPERLIEAYARVRNDNQLVMVGPDDFFAAKLKTLVKKSNQEKRIIFYHSSKIEDLVYLYRNAKALIHPSLSEGFGLPIIEAIYYNLPIIGSNIEVFREILEDKYLQFNPLDVSDIQTKIEFFLEKKPKADYGNLIKKYSFEEMTKQTLEIYKKSL